MAWLPGSRRDWHAFWTPSSLQPRDVHSTESLETAVRVPGWWRPHPLTPRLCGTDQARFEPRERCASAEGTHCVKKPVREAFFCFSAANLAVIRCRLKKIIKV